jgi:2-polyprenyl-3-methyl-5-hydroxy-6-metoxy-1,4-benzoquinol methylase
MQVRLRGSTKGLPRINARYILFATGSKRGNSVKFHQAEQILKQTFEEVRNQHAQAGHEFIRTHWKRYAHLVWRLPVLGPENRVLEIGASILSNLIRRRFGCTVHTIYHEIETEWPVRFESDGIIGYPIELIRDTLPVDDGGYDCILFNEVMEHLPLKPDFLMRQIIAKLKPQGVLLFSVPNFATSEKRIAMLKGINPQDPMDATYVYYAHHREPVMRECVDLIRQCGGIVNRAEWCDCDVAPGLPATLWHCLRHLRHGKLHRIVHQVLPSMRAYIIICATKDSGVSPQQDLDPPLSKTREFFRLG